MAGGRGKVHAADNPRWRGDESQVKVLNSAPEAADLSKMRNGRVISIFALLSLAMGCDTTYLTRGPAPLGPGAATGTDLRPWLIDAPTIARVGRLDNFYVESQLGQYVTWSLVTKDTTMCTEVDIRRCAVAAEQLRDQQVLIHGKLIDRGPRHYPLLVAERIERADEGKTAPGITVASRVTD